MCCLPFALLAGVFGKFPKSHQLGKGIIRTVITQSLRHGEIKKIMIIPTHPKKGRSLSLSPVIKRYFELIFNWKTENKNRKIEKITKISFDDWLEKSGLTVDQETQKAVNEAPRRSTLE